MVHLSSLKICQYIGAQDGPGDGLFGATPKLPLYI